VQEVLLFLLSGCQTDLRWPQLLHVRGRRPADLGEFHFGDRPIVAGQQIPITGKGVHSQNGAPVGTPDLDACAGQHIDRLARPGILRPKFLRDRGLENYRRNASIMDLNIDSRARPHKHEPSKSQPGGMAAAVRMSPS
jgi:hypothetical protein